METHIVMLMCTHAHTFTHTSVTTLYYLTASKCSSS